MSTSTDISRADIRGRQQYQGPGYLNRRRVSWDTNAPDQTGLTTCTKGRNGDKSSQYYPIGRSASDDCKDRAYKEGRVEGDFPADDIGRQAPKN